MLRFQTRIKRSVSFPYQQMIIIKSRSPAFFTEISRFLGITIQISCVSGLRGYDWFKPKCDMHGLWKSKMEYLLITGNAGHFSKLKQNGNKLY